MSEDCITIEKLPAAITAAAATHPAATFFLVRNSLIFIFLFILSHLSDIDVRNTILFTAIQLPEHQSYSYFNTQKNRLIKLNGRIS